MAMEWIWQQYSNLSLTAPSRVVIRDPRLGLIRIIAIAVILTASVSWLLPACFVKVDVGSRVIGQLSLAAPSKRARRPDLQTRRLPCAPLQLQTMIVLASDARRMASWLNDDGYIGLTEKYKHDQCEGRSLGNIMYGSQVVGLLFNNLGETRGRLEKSGIASSSFTAWGRVDPPLEDSLAGRWGIQDLHIPGTGYETVRSLAVVLAGSKSGSAGATAGGVSNWTLQLSTGQFLRVINVTNGGRRLCVVSRQESEVCGSLEDNRLKWSGDVYDFEGCGEGGCVWERMPDYEPTSYKHLQDLKGSSPAVVGLGLGPWDKPTFWNATGVSSFLRGLPDEEAIVVLYRSAGGLPCFDLPPEVFVKQLDTTNVLLTSAEAHSCSRQKLLPRHVLEGVRPINSRPPGAAAAEPRSPPSPPRRAEPWPEYHRHIGTSVFRQADEAVLELAFSISGFSGDMTTTIATCSDLGGACDDLKQAETQRTTFLGMDAQVLYLNMSDLLERSNLDDMIDKCAYTNGCSVLLEMEFSSNPLASPSVVWSAVTAGSVGPAFARLRVFSSVGAYGSVRGYEEHAAGADAISQVHYRGIRVKLKFSGAFRKWTVSQGLVSFATGLKYLESATALTVAVAIGSMGFSCVGKKLLGQNMRLYSTYVNNYTVSESVIRGEFAKAHHDGDEGRAALRLAEERVRNQLTLVSDKEGMSLVNEKEVRLLVGADAFSEVSDSCSDEDDSCFDEAVAELPTRSEK